MSPSQRLIEEAQILLASELGQVRAFVDIIDSGTDGMATVIRQLEDIPAYKLRGLLFASCLALAGARGALTVPPAPRNEGDAT